jgi:ribosome production factor 2
MKSKALVKNKRPTMVAATPSKMKNAAKKKIKRKERAGVIGVLGAESEADKPAKPIKRKARVVRLLKKREPQIVEETKNVLVLKGHKVSEVVREVLLDINQLTKPNNKVFSRNNDILPFEEIESLEFLCNKNQCALFCLGSHNKKRPDNIVLGRMYDGHLLDMYEFGVSQFSALTEFSGAKKRIGSKPVLVLNGDQWQTDAIYRRIGNLLMDLFRADKSDKISLKGMDHVISCSVADGKIYIRGYIMGFYKSGTKVPAIELSPMGPFLDLTLRRSQLPSEDLWKLATKRPPTVEKKAKNVKKTVLGEKLGRIHMKKQNLDKMGGKKTTVLRGGKRTLVDVDEKFGTATVRNTKKSRLA